MMDNIDKIDEEFEKIVASSLWWQGIISECLRKQRVSELNIPIDHKVITIQMLMEAISITDEQLSLAKTSPDYIEARTIISNLNRGDEFPDRLTEIYKFRIPKAIQELNQMIYRLVPVLNNIACKEEVEDALRLNTSVKIFAQALIQKYNVKAPAQKRALLTIAKLSQLKSEVACWDYPFSFTTYSPGSVGDGSRNIDRADLLAYCVYDPLWGIERIQYTPECMSFPLKWSSDLPVTTVRNLYQQHNDGKDVLSDLFKHYSQADALNGLADAIRHCPVVCQHYPLFKEAVEAFKAELFRICSVSLLSLIEGMIWSFAWWWNERKGPIFDRALPPEAYKNADFELITTKSEIIRKPTIGHLLRSTTFGDEIYDEFVEFYCSELYAERNPVLHGRESQYGTPKKAVTLLHVAQVIMNHVTREFADDLCKNGLVASTKPANINNSI